VAKCVRSQATVLVRRNDGVVVGPSGEHAVSKYMIDSIRVRRTNCHCQQTHVSSTLCTWPTACCVCRHCKRQLVAMKRQLSSCVSTASCRQLDP
jgi:hypothetical protein